MTTDLPKLAELYEVDKAEKAFKQDCNWQIKQNPNPAWVK